MGRCVPDHVYERVPIQLREHGTRARELLQHEALAAEHPRAYLARHENVELHRLLGAQECVLVHDHALAARQLERQHLAREIGRERHLAGTALRREVHDEDGGT